MGKIRLYPGIVGFAILVAVFFLAIAKRFDLEESFLIILVTSPLAAIFCVGAHVKGIRDLKRRNRDADDARSGILRWTDVCLGFVGVCVIIVSALGFEMDSGHAPARIASIAVLLASSVAGYFMFFKWPSYDSGERAGLAFAWILGIVVFFVVSLSDVPSTESPQSNRDAIINDLNNIAAQAYQYRIRPKSMGGGNGSYRGLKIPTRMQSNANGSYACLPSANEVTFLAISAEDSNNTIIIRIDSEGRFIKSAWKVTGDLDPTPPKWLVYSHAEE